MSSIPQTSPVEFFPMGLTLYIFPERGKMLDNIQENPHISVAVYAHFRGGEHMNGLRMTGIAETGTRDAKIFEEGLEAYMARAGSRSRAMPVMYWGGRPAHFTSSAYP